jgi:hypothetical protein
MVRTYKDVNRTVSTDKEIKRHQRQLSRIGLGARPKGFNGFDEKDKRIRCPSCLELYQSVDKLQLNACRRCHRPYGEEDAPLWKMALAGVRA